MKKRRGYVRYYVKSAGYRQGYTGADHLLPDDHSGMLGRWYDSREAIQGELERRTTASAPAYAVVAEVELPLSIVEDTWNALADATESSRQPYTEDFVRRCRRLAKEQSLIQLRFLPDGRIEVGDYPRDWTIHRNEIGAPVGDADKFQVREFILRA